MKKNLLAVLLSFSLVFFPARDSNAILPLLAFADLAYAVIESFAVRSVANEVIATVGTAANDASWVSTFAQWMQSARVIGSLAFHLSNTQGTSVPITSVEVQVASNVSVLTKGTLGNGFKIYNYPYVAAGISIDGVAHYPPVLKGSDVNALAASALTWFNSYALPAFQANLDAPCYVDANNSSVYWCNFAAGSRSFQFNVVSIEQADGIGRIIGTPGSWSADASDPDWTPQQLASISGMSSLRFDGTTIANGNHAVIDLAPSGKGVRISYLEQLANSQLRQLDVITGTLFIPVAYDQVQSAGLISSDPSFNPSSGSSPVIFPNDYARTGEAAAAANILAPKLDTLHQDLSVVANVADPLEVDQATMPTFGTTFDNLKAWNLPAHASTCPAPDIDLSSVFGAGHVYHFNAHCQLVQDHFAALQAAMMVCWSLMAMFVVLRA
jgi:hypothetical protein